MASSSSIETLITIATVDTDNAAKRLGNEIRYSEEQENKLVQLQQYRDDYAQRFQERLASGLNASGYRNFQLFLEKLDLAMVRQRQIIAEAARRVEQARQLWQQCERRRKSYGTLETRARQEEHRKELRRDQKSTDEHATRQAFYKR
ncbi:MAG: flagellar export protein FliJ [Janthinobacterium lividum]